MRLRQRWKGCYAALAAALACGAIAPARGQENILRQFNIISPTQGGLQLNAVSVFSSYYSGYTPLAVTVPGRENDTEAYGGVSASLGWGLLGTNSSTSLTYSLSYMRSLTGIRVSAWNQNHGTSFDWNHDIGAKWEIGVSAGGSLMNIEQALFSSTALSSAASSQPASIEDLAAGVQSGGLGNSAFASMLTGASYASTPERTFVYGDRALNANAGVRLSYAPTTRTSLNFSMSGSRLQRLPRNDATVDTSILGNTTAATVRIGWAYSMSPRTRLGISAEANRVFSRFQDGYVTRVEFSGSRTLSQRLFAQGRFGAGYITYSRQTFVAQTGVDYSAGGALGFKTRSHTFLASGDRTVSDGYGLGAGSTILASGAWSWRGRGSPWSVTGSAGYQILQGSILGELKSWTLVAALARSLGSHLIFSVNYGYSELPAVLSRPDLSQSGANVSLTWSPVAYR